MSTAQTAKTIKIILVIFFVIFIVWVVKFVYFQQGKDHSIENSLYDNSQNEITQDKKVDEQEEKKESDMQEKELINPQGINDILFSKIYEHGNQYLSDISEYKYKNPIFEEWNPEMKILYGDVTQDGRDEAVVGIHSGARAGIMAVMIFSMGKDDVQLLDTIHASQMIPYIEDNNLTIHIPGYDDDDAYCCPSFYNVNSYEWNGDNFEISDTQRFEGKEYQEYMNDGSEQEEFPSVFIDVDENTMKYVSNELGLEFTYSKKLGGLQESRYKAQELLWAKFLNDEGGIQTDIEFRKNDKSQEDLYDYERTCEDILEKGYRGGDVFVDECEKITIDGRQVTVVRILEKRVYSERADQGWYTTTPSLAVSFKTKLGGWGFYSTDKNVFDDLMALVETLKFHEEK